MKASSAISARATTALRPTGPSSAKPRPTPTSAEAFTLKGPSVLPDPKLHAYRKDLADARLAGHVIASHYAEPRERVIVRPTALRDAPRTEAYLIRQMEPGERFSMLDDSLGWAWGYAGEEMRVGYLQSSALDQEPAERSQTSW